MTDLFATITAADAHVIGTHPAGLPFDPKKVTPVLTVETLRKARAIIDASDRIHPTVFIEPGTPLALSAPAPITRAHAHLACNLTVLALDLGTATGFAIAPRGKPVRSGSFRLDPNKLGGNGRRWIAFREWLTATAREVGGVQVVYVEDVRRHVSNLSARVYCGYLAMLEAWCAANNVRLEGVGVGTIKKAFTGKGNADKGAMMAEARKRGVSVSDDNQADAVALLAYAIEQEA